MTLQAVLFDVDFTIARPGPELGPEGYRRLGERFGLELDPARYGEAREKAVESIRRHPELEHDEQIWVAFTERIIRGMGGDSAAAHECAVAMTKAWEHAEHFELYEDALPVLGELRAHGLRTGLLRDGDVEGLGAAVRVIGPHADPKPVRETEEHRLGLSACVRTHDVDLARRGEQARGDAVIAGDARRRGDADLLELLDMALDGAGVAAGPAGQDELADHRGPGAREEQLRGARAHR